MNKVKDSLPLHAFVRRQQVLRMFRALLRGASDLEDRSLVGPVHDQIRFEFKNNAKITDNVALRNLIQDGQRQLSKLQSMGTKALKQRQAGSGEEGLHAPSGHAGSWLNDGAADAEDIRGRVGTKWPWIT